MKKHGDFDIIAVKVIKKIGKGNLRHNSRKFAKKKENYNVKA
ncbi:MAG: hypothetical protein SO149_07900 [Candidatus Fimenecus sp.]|nr:hypothetical protein [Candidatus Fimenecus sp.]